MTTSEAIEILTWYKKSWQNLASVPKYGSSHLIDAVELAIKALEAQPTSEIVPIGTKVRVLECNTSAYFEVGDIVEITGYDLEPPEYKCTKGIHYWWLSREEFEPV